MREMRHYGQGSHLCCDQGSGSECGVGWPVSEHHLELLSVGLGDHSVTGHRTSDDLHRSPQKATKATKSPVWTLLEPTQRPCEAPQATTSHSAGGQDVFSLGREAHSAHQCGEDLLGPQDYFNDTALNDRLSLVDGGALSDNLRYEGRDTI